MDFSHAIEKGMSGLVPDLKDLSFAGIKLTYKRTKLSHLHAGENIEDTIILILSANRSLLHF